MPGGTETEMLIQQVLERLMVCWMMLIIAHRLSMISQFGRDRGAGGPAHRRDRHMGEILNRLHLQSRKEAVAYAVRGGLDKGF